jgi:hypothetical protein
MDMDLRALKRFFTYHAPHGDQAERYQKIRSTAKELAMLIYDECPDSDERSKAVERLRETVFWANAAIACNE